MPDIRQLAKSALPGRVWTEDGCTHPERRVYLPLPEPPSPRTAQPPQEPPPVLSPQGCQMARERRGWIPSQLGFKAHLDTEALKAFEAGERDLSDRAKRLILAAFARCPI